MTTFSHLRKTALSLPATTEEETAAGAFVYSTGGKRFAASDRKRVELRLLPEDLEKLLARHPDAERSGGDGVRIELKGINGQQLNHWLRRAWYSRASDELRRQADAGASAAPGAVGDLPRSIGAPATRALAGAGITTLDQVAERSEAELLALHGVGPRAIRILKEALSASGRELAG